MRLGVAVDIDGIDLTSVPALAGALEAAGLEMVWWRSGTGSRSTMAAAASCAGVTGLLVGAQVQVDGTHPVHLAEERNVVDQLLGGRLVLGVTGSGDAGLDDEWLHVLLAAGGTRPFRHEGTTFRVPGGLPQNTINPEVRVRVTPAPFSLEPATWFRGATELAVRYGLSHLADEHDLVDDVAVAALRDLATPARLRVRTPGTFRWAPATTDAADLARRLVEHRDDWGLDTALIELGLPAGGDDWQHAVSELTRVVRPRVQLDDLPAGLVEFWDDRRERRSTPRKEEA